MIGSGDCWDKSPSWFLKILKLPSFYSGNFKIFENAFGQFISNRPSKHVTTSTNCRFFWLIRWHWTLFRWLFRIRHWIFNFIAHAINNFLKEHHLMYSWCHMLPYFLRDTGHSLPICAVIENGSDVNGFCSTFKNSGVVYSLFFFSFLS